MIYEEELKKAKVKAKAKARLQDIEEIRAKAKRKAERMYRPKRIMAKDTGKKVKKTFLSVDKWMQKNIADSNEMRKKMKDL